MDKDIDKNPSETPMITDLGDASSLIRGLGLGKEPGAADGDFGALQVSG